MYAGGDADETGGPIQSRIIEGGRHDSEETAAAADRQTPITQSICQPGIKDPGRYEYEK